LIFYTICYGYPENRIYKRVGTLIYFFIKKGIVIVATFFLFFSVIAQKRNQPTQESIRIELSKGMVNFISSIKPYCKKGQSKQEFINYVCTPWKPTNEGSALLGKAYDLINTGVSNENILVSYNAKEMASAVIYLKKITNINSKSDASELFGGKTGVNDNILARAANEGCKWYQVWCHLQGFAQWVVDNWDTISQILTAIAALL
jgi:hypothetical protein